jgi:hypothetical protein
MSMPRNAKQTAMQNAKAAEAFRRLFVDEEETATSSIIISDGSLRLGLYYESQHAANA